MTKSDPLGTQIREYREQRGISLGKLEQLTKGRLTRGTASKAETAGYPSVPTLELYAEALGCKFVIGPDQTYLEPWHPRTG